LTCAGLLLLLEVFSSVAYYIQFSDKQGDNKRHSSLGFFCFGDGSFVDLQRNEVLSPELLFCAGMSSERVEFC